MPSRLRRILVIVAYVLAASIAVFLGTQALLTAGVFSRECLDHDRCTSGENWLNVALGLCWIVAVVACIGLGWRGWLFGCRARAQTAAQ